MISIIGAGMAGLLAARMLQHHADVVVYEQQPQLPNNHSAVLRFRSDIVSLTLGIPFKKVRMIKAPLPWKNPVADALAYSFKNTGTHRSDRSITDGMVVADRYIAPQDLISRMAERVMIKFSNEVTNLDKHNVNEFEDPIISTMPMPVLMQLLKYPNIPAFDFLPGTNIRCKIMNCDAYCSLLVPDPQYRFSRISITGDDLIIEMPSNQSGEIDYDVVGQVTDLLGLEDEAVAVMYAARQTYAKINPIDDELRKSFMHWATVKFNIYSLGRYATWRPKLLLDDLVQDVRLIERWIGRKNKYDVAKHL